RQILRLLIVVAPPEERVVHQRVLDVHEYTAGGIDVGELFDDEDRVEERRAGASPAVGDLDTHDPELEEACDEVFRHFRIVVHLMDQRTDPLDGEVAHALLEHLFFLREDREGSTGLDFDGLGGHGAADYRTQDSGLRTQWKINQMKA